MPTLRQLLCTSLASSLLFTAGTAEARFGKRSDSSSSSSDNVHDASPVGSNNGNSGGSSSGGSSSSNDVANTVGTILDIIHIAADVAELASHYQEATTTYETAPAEVPQAQPAPGEQPMYAYGQEPVVQQRIQTSEVRNRNTLMFRVNAEGLALGEGSAVGLNAGIEGERFGVALAGTGMRLPTDDGTAGEDKIDLFSLHLTLAVYADDQTRLRLEGGFASAKAPDATFTGPSLALSFERCLLGSLDLETRAQIVPAPHLQLDAQAGLALHLSAINLRAGWRVLMLDDRGLVDGVVHRDSFSGPYAGVGLYF
ncbi:MAG TPA: hypothetical protein VFZ09_26745 [Archangium sp.]|uniref:hypothetical protein n=1 Tax=Archangium sp. TaxID=1872627 RepID=UPI002E30672E|nr:hypothetical protein [Archangium sp.]HEX5749858.1 hypothetical protein [Archangium sp.]